MNEEPIDLSTLAPDEPSDQVKPAIKRFRIRVVFFTLLCIAVVTAAVGFAIAYRVEKQRFVEMAIELQTQPQWETNYGYANCITPTIPFRGADVRLVSITGHYVFPPGVTPSEPVSLQQDGWAVQIWFEPHADGPVIIDPQNENNRLSLSGPQVENAFTVGTPGWEVAPMYAVVHEAPDGLLHMDVIDINRKRIGKITLDPHVFASGASCSDLFFPTTRESDDNAVSMQALFQGPLVIRDDCVLIGLGGEYSIPVWPEGFSATEDANGSVLIRNDEGEVVAEEDRPFEMGGGYIAEFEPKERVDPRGEQLAGLSDSLGFQFPDRCLGPDVYGVWGVGETSPLPY